MSCWVALCHQDHPATARPCARHWPFRRHWWRSWNWSHQDASAWTSWAGPSGKSGVDLLERLTYGNSNDQIKGTVRECFPPIEPTPMSSVRSCKASCHSDAFSQALSREFMVIKVGCRRLLWISSSKCKFRGQASWKPWIGMACIAWPKVCPSLKGLFLFRFTVGAH